MLHSARVSPSRLIAPALGVALAVVTGLITSSDGATAAPAPPRPNILVVMTDDQPVSHVIPRAMPATVKHLQRKGTRFTDSIVTTPLCCPSRAAFLTGQYAHNNGVFDNEPGYTALDNPDSTLFSWLRDAGYRTGYVGRFLLNYERSFDPPDNFEPDPDPYDEEPPPDPKPPFWPAPPGVDDWFGYAESQTLYLGAQFSDNGARVQATAKANSYTTRIINREARDFIRDSAAVDRPFFLSVAHIAPHTTNFHPGKKCGSGAALAEPKFYRHFRDEPLPTPRSFNERKIRDKPAWVDFRDRLGAGKRRALRKAWRCALAAAGSVDRGVAGLIRELRAQDELNRTAIFFTSDNGYLYGEHRIVLQKVYPYEESIRVPLLARVPRPYLGLTGKQRRPRRAGQLVANTDLTATILELAGATPCTAAGNCRTLDGRSLIPLLRGAPEGWPTGRGILIQTGTNRTCGQLPEPRGLNNFYDAIRTPGHLYVELDRVNKETGACDRPERELYDLAADPFQLRNRAVDPALVPPDPLQTDLAQRLTQLRACAGVGGRDAPVPAADGAPRPLCE
jgi:arylsulfatase A-like enzyme